MRALALLMLAGAGTYVIHTMLTAHGRHLSPAVEAGTIALWYAILLAAMLVLLSGKRKR